MHRRWWLSSSNSAIRFILHSTDCCIVLTVQSDAKHILLSSFNSAIRSTVLISQQHFQFNEIHSMYIDCFIYNQVQSDSSYWLRIAATFVFPLKFSLIEEWKTYFLNREAEKRLNCSTFLISAVLFSLSNQMLIIIIIINIIMF